MLREFKEADIDKIMELWRDGNFKAHSFIKSEYFATNYNKVQNQYLRKSDTWVYTENGEIQGFISVMQDRIYWCYFYYSRNTKRRNRNNTN